MNLEARTAIEALRAGVPNRAAVRLMGTAEPSLEQAFNEQLELAWDKRPRPGLGIAGGFGAGKSHFLFYLAEVARAKNFVVSHVVVSKETPLADTLRVFEAAVRAAVLPDRPDDAITGALTILRQSRDKMAALQAAVQQVGEALAPVFSALLFLLQRDTLPGSFARQLERFLAGGKIRSSDVRQALASVGEKRKFDLRLPVTAVLVEQRLQFLTMVLHAAGYAGWCLMFDEVELIGRYTPLRRAVAYARLTSWLGLEGARAMPGLVATYAITDDFVTAVIDERQDEVKLAARLREKERHHEGRLATTAMRHIAQSVRTRRLRAPGSDELVHAGQRLNEIYREAYGWNPPPTASPERTATRTMRQYIKGWITEWDMRRLTGKGTRIVTEGITANYAEDELISTPSADDPD